MDRVMNNLLFLSIICLITGFILFVWTWRRQKKSGLPSGRIIYADTGNWRKIEAALYDAELQLTGKPDYLVENQDGIIPVEVKSSHLTDAPYDSHIYQLAAYCRLVETNFNHRPPYGIIHYPQKTFAIDYTPALESALLEKLDLIRSQSQQAGKRKSNIHRSHQSAERCRGCGYKEICDETLDK
jgi:CRISPR-associated exonuclease Cas4